MQSLSSQGPQCLLRTRGRGFPPKCFPTLRAKALPQRQDSSLDQCFLQPTHWQDQVTRGLWKPSDVATPLLSLQLTWTLR